MVFRPARAAALAALACAVFAAPLPARAAAAAADEHARLDRGEVIVETRGVPGSEYPLVRGTAVIDAPPEKLWRFVQDCRLYAGRLPRVVRSRELSREGSVAVCETVSDLPFPFGDLTSVTRATHEVTGGVWARRWMLVRGDYLRNSGSWLLTTFDAEGRRTLLRYELHVEPRLPVPVALQRSAQKRGMPDLMRRLRELMREP